MKELSLDRMESLVGGQQMTVAGQRLAKFKPSTGPVIKHGTQSQCIMFGVGGVLAIFGLVTGPIGWAGSTAFVVNWYLHGSGC